ncbi:hypothetical protein [Marinicellulosiphila megalodicopiae]|uniref:hypothetical protein n=1 Tax=Marinicellulosiphila megalodicopiae TaxID=2724896 RepID=UPI003BB15AFE
MKFSHSVNLVFFTLVMFGASQLSMSESSTDDTNNNQKTQTYNLKDGSIITGSLINEDADQIILMTRFGETTINKNDLLVKKITVSLKSGEVVIGSIQNETPKELVIKTTYGVITIDKKDVVDFNEKTTNNNNADDKFVLAEDYLIDVFGDPTGNTLKKDTVYISGLSVGYAFSDSFQVSTRYDGFFYQNVNLRPKFRILNLGNWKRQLTASVGFHAHSNWRLTNFHKETKYCPELNNPDACYYDNTYTPLTELNNDEYTFYSYEEFMPMIEVFAATSYAKTRSDSKGRVQYTMGASAKFVEGAQSHRAYAAIDIDLNKRLKLITEVIYDPFYNAESLPTTAPFENVYIDLGAMYTFDNNLSVGMHMMPYWVTLYWKQ